MMRYVMLSALWLLSLFVQAQVWGIERSGFFNGRGKWAKDFDNQRV